MLETLSSRPLKTGSRKIRADRRARGYIGNELDEDEIKHEEEEQDDEAEHGDKDDDRGDGEEGRAS